VILAANHRCTIDPVLLTIASPHRLVAYVMIEQYYDLPLFGRVLKGLNCIPIRRDGRDTAGAKAALRHLKNGGVLGIFPEGGIPLPGEKRDPKEGVALLALRTRATVVPAYVSGTRYSENYFPPFVWRHHARVRYGKPIDLSRYYDKAHDRETLAEVARLIMDRINELRPEDQGKDP
jgi:1-acyl-sn-glycerol-3-phosphate acyltransferase